MVARSEGPDATLVTSSFSSHPLFGPWSDATRLAVVIRCSNVSAPELVDSLNSLFRSTFQNFVIYCVGAEDDTVRVLSGWALTDPRVRFVATIPDNFTSMGAVLVMPGGSVLTRFSLEALFEVLGLPGVVVVRTVVEGLKGSIEFWTTQGMPDSDSWSSLEQTARKNKAERWISAEGIGIHASGRPEPKVFFRRGAANRHEIDVVAFDARSKSYMTKQDQRIDMLEKKLRSLSRANTPRSIRIQSRFNRFFAKVFK